MVPLLENVSNIQQRSHVRRAHARKRTWGKTTGKFLNGNNVIETMILILSDFVSPGGHSSIKVRGMLEVSFRSVNCKFWSQRCLRRKITIFAYSGIA